ncbi:MFS transporter [Nocardioides panzhihuensis]|uniref:MFS family permease n=1 Tax=Nocardioides panzhihuensis TaxID=860243 RepID=A0A7Z0DN43_9ACTN|nr:MFS transporter [Nocardioides panzhihuensis]NYI78527.1 MFS family permease [Nocardioides panzhihuensis]
MDRTAALRNRRFLVVIGGEGLSMTGDAAFAISLAWLVLEATGSPAALTGVLLAQTIPRGALLLIGGSVTDRLTPRTVMIACHVLRAAGAAVVCALVVAGTWELWHLYALAVVMGAAGAFFTPAADSVLPQLLSPVHYARGNAIQSITEQVSFLIGPLAGGVLTTAYGAGIAIGANAVTFGVAAITCLAIPSLAIPSLAIPSLAIPSLAIPSLAIPSRHGTSAAPAGLGRHVVEGLRYAWRTHSMRVVLLVVSAATLSYSGLFAIGLPVLARSMGETALGLSVLVSSWGAGQLIGALAAAITGLPRRWGWLIITMTLAEGAVFILLGQVSGIWWAAALLLPLGVGVAYSSDVALPTFIQTTTPRHLLARANSILALSRAVFEPLSIAMLGLVLQRSVPWGFAAAALPVLLAGMILVASSRARALSTGTW